MLIRIAQGWELPESAATPERFVTGRRAALGGMLAGAAAIGLSRNAIAAPPPLVATNALYVPGRAVTPETAASTYNNFYEFGTDKSIAHAAQRMPLSPWSISFSGMVDKPRTLSLDELLRAVPVEQRVLRHRCVEAWAMTVPWTGMPLAKLVELAAPMSGARYVTFTTASMPSVMPGMHDALYPWPYTEGLTLAEATNPLAFVATGMYGHGLGAQNGGPIRLLTPWKYGFKSAKSIVDIKFTDTRPATFWEAINPEEYGFWANVNPAVPHPRWSQASERLLGSDERVATQPFNGYAEFVASLYPADADRSYFF